MVSPLTNGCLELQEEINLKNGRQTSTEKDPHFKKSCLERVRQLDVDMVKKGNKLAHLALVTDFFAPSHTRMQLHIIC